ncbi:hypothetical protein FOMPIDRAFT_117154 [Fomitopsis schrenkii]|uniref:F-box domain-containing protein n=1 Tax=Fomitopsis schrenkii TaxID=2126942 RepID=S8DQR0_FOMSC|nr:hypothetical protein FOMPIDRAFT_117154 [Fomitopsis schrenkii]
MDALFSSLKLEASYPHALPLEVIHEPVLYRSVVLTSCRRITAFERTLRHTPRLSSTVHNLWIGPDSTHTQHDLSYASSAWPVTLLHQILVKCTNVKSLALINFAQHLMYRIVGIIPASVTSIHAGPVHGHFDIRHLRCAPGLARVTSMDTYLSDLEVQELTSAPFLRSFRRFYSTRTAIEYAFDQLAAVRVGRVLETMEIVCCTGAGDLEGTLAILKDLARGREGSDDDRVVISARTTRTEDGRPDGIRAFYDDWVDNLDAGGPDRVAAGAYRKTYFADVVQGCFLYWGFVIACGSCTVLPVFEVRMAFF